MNDTGDEVAAVKVNAVVSANSAVQEAEKKTVRLIDAGSVVNNRFSKGGEDDSSTKG